mgnify:CR=1 FL=1|tara:strand:+ start:561 stop:1007 length:447 start_codon:yes stop_codon:yes gene_type:complete
MPVKSFRGKIADDSIDTINLHTNDGSTGYRIVKFQIMTAEPATTSTEQVVKIYKIPQTTATADIDFSDNTLLAVGYFENSSGMSGPTASSNIIFDNEVFNQDIFVTHVDANSTAAINYYIELEQIKLDLNANTMATLKDIKNIEASTL